MKLRRTKEFMHQWKFPHRLETYVGKLQGLRCSFRQSLGGEPSIQTLTPANALKAFRTAPQAKRSIAAHYLQLRYPHLKIAVRSSALRQHCWILAAARLKAPAIEAPTFSA